MVIWSVPMETVVLDRCFNGMVIRAQFDPTHSAGNGRLDDFIDPVATV